MGNEIIFTDPVHRHLSLNESYDFYFTFALCLVYRKGRIIEQKVELDKIGTTGANNKMPENSGKKPGRVLKISFAIVAVCIFFVLAEIGARSFLRLNFKYKYKDLLIHYNHPIAETFGESLDYHPLYHWLWKGGTRFRRGMVPALKDSNTYRIITLGDSCTWGVLVGPDQTYSFLLEKMLQEHYGNEAKIEVLNGGVLGFSSLQMLRYLAHDLGPYDPDLVIVRGNWDDSPVGTDPYVVVNEKDGLTGVRALLAESKAYYFIKYLTLRGKKSFFQKRDPKKSEDGITNYHLMRDLAKERGFELMIAEYQYKQKDGKIHVAPDNRKYDWPAPYIKMQEAYLESGLLPDQYLLDEVHPSVKGHKFIAGQVYNEVVRLGFIDRWLLEPKKDKKPAKE